MRSARGVLPSLLIVAAAILAYANTLGAPFVFDDVLAIPQNPTIRHGWRLDEALFPPAGGTTVSGRPLLNVSLALNYAISGVAPWSYHVVNTLIHAAAGLLLFGIVRRTLERHAANTGAAAGAGRTWPTLNPSVSALFVALLWVAHPLQTQAVTYTVQRAESLMGLFYLLTLYAFVRSVDDRGADTTPETTLEQRRWQYLSFGACLCGMATKEVMATAPLVVLLYDRTFVAGSFGESWRRRRGYYLALAATWILLGALVLSTGNRGGTAGFGTGIALWAYPLTQFQAVARYLGLSVWPHPLIFEYGTFWVHHAGDLMPYAAVLLPLLIGTVVALWRAPALGFCGAWFCLILAPTSLTPGTLQMIVEHRMYLPLAAVLALGVVGMQRVLRRAAPAILIAATLASVVLTAHRNRVYASHLALWTDTVTKRPDNPRARGGLAEALEEAGRAEEAIVQRTEATRRSPQDARAHLNLANALLAAGRQPDAIREFEATLALDPADAKAHNNLAIAYRAAGRAEEALAHNTAAARLAPDNADFRLNCGTALMRAGRNEDAVVEFSAVLRLRPQDVDAHYNLGAALMRLRRIEEAVSHFDEAARLQPADAEIRGTLGRAEAEWADRLLDADHIPEATRHYESAIKHVPGDATVHHNLGIAYARQERWAEAQREFETALRLKPDYAEAREHLKQVREVRQ